MQYSNLVCSAPPHVDLSSFAELLFSELGAPQYQERESSNYVGGSYFSGQIDGMKVSLALSEDALLPYWINLSSDSMSANLFRATVDNLIQGTLHRLALKLVGISNFGRQDEERIEYFTD